MESHDAIVSELSCQVQSNYYVCNNPTCVFFNLQGEIYLSIHDCVVDGAIMYGCNYNTHAGSIIL